MKDLSVSKRLRSWGQILFSILVISSLIVGCNLPTKKSSEAPTLPPETATTKEAKLPTPEPRKDLPPALVEVTPIPGSQIGLLQPITLYFNQPMDKSSVEAAIRLEPSTSGRFTWEDDQILTFIPDQALYAGTRFRVLLNTNAQAANKKKLQESLEVHFQTAETLQVLQSVPSDGAEDIDPESIIFVSFNQPVVPLGGESQALPAFSLSPEVPGKGEWLNTSTYIFTPQTSMDGGRLYEIRLDENLIATSGAGLDPSQELQFNFTTTKPAVLSILPIPEEPLSLDGPIEVQFNIRMNTESVEAHFDLVAPNGIAIPGSFDWDETAKAFSFKPNKLLNRNTAYTIRLSPGAESIGRLPIEETVETVRTTYPFFSVDPYTFPNFESYSNQYGVYRIKFTTPLNKKNYRELVSLSPEVGSMSLYLWDEDKTLNISGFFTPDSQYTITLDADLQDIWGDQLGESFVDTFITPPAEPSLSVVTGPSLHNLVFVPASESVIVMQATNINSITLKLSPISIEDLTTLVHPDNYDYRQVFLPEFLEATTQTFDLPRNKSEVVRIPLSYQGVPLSPGIYFLGISTPDIKDLQTEFVQKLFLIVSDNNLIFKVSPEQALVWGTRLEDYTSLTDAPVSVYTTEGVLLTKGLTNQDGLFTAQYERSGEGYNTYYCLVGKPGEDNFAFSISTWGQYYTYYDSSIRMDTSPALIESYIYTDRPLYRPGDTVYFKAAVFSRDNGIPTSSGLESVTLNVYSDYGLAGLPEKLYAKELTLSQFGTVADSVQLPQSATTGSYRIELIKDERTIKNFYFDVAAYRKPEIELAVAFNQAEITAAENLIADIQADYYFGMPASNQAFNWSIFTDETYFRLPGYRVGPLKMDWYTQFMPGYPSPLGTFLKSGQAITDGNGHAQVVLDPGDLSLEDLGDGTLQKINFEVTFTDESGFLVSYKDSAYLHSEAFYIGVKPESYYGRANTPLDFSILTVDWEKGAVGDIPLEATFEAIEWRVEETNNPEMPYRYVPKTTLIDSASPVSDDEGRVRLSFTPPDPGTYQLTLKSGKAITQVMTWVTGEGSPVWPSQLQNQITLTADAEDYQPGQIAQIFFPNPFLEGAKALITVERGKVMETQIIDLTESGHILSLPINEESVPNIYVSVTLLGKDENGHPNFRQGTLNLSVAPLSKSLNVELLLDPFDTKPGETVSAKLFITDSRGNPVQGEFSIAVVDKALLALAEPNSPNIISAFYGERPLSVQTSLSLKTYASQLVLMPLAYGLGGGGMEPVPQINLREDFPDTAFWHATILTGTDGTAQLSIPMPDSLTTWVVNVRGLTEDYLVGQTEAEILTHKDLMIRPVTPRFLVDGDEVEMAAVVHNDTPQPLEVDVSLDGPGFTLEDPARQTQRVTITSGGRERVSWRGTVESVETVSLIFQAVSGAYADASTPIWGDLQVKRYTMPLTFSTAGQLTEEGSRLELVSLPISTDPSSGALTLELTPSLTTTLVDGLQTLKANTYGGTISILSALLANLNAYQALNKIGINSPQLESNLAEWVDEEILALLNAQNYDGGWNWFPGDDPESATSDMLTTTYVLIGLTQAAQAGMDVPEHFIERAEQFIFNQMLSPGDIDTGWKLDRLTFQVYALRYSHFALNNTLDGLYSRRSELSPWALSLLGLSIREIEGRDNRITTLLSDLENKAIRSATGVHWESERDAWLLPGTPIFNTSLGMLALAQLDPASTSLPLALQYLLTHRESDGLWSSTFDSAWALMAVTETLKGTGDYQAEFEFQASLNDQLIATGIADGTAATAAVTATTDIGDLYPESPNALTIERGAGTGTLYYRADLQTYQPAASAEPIDRGISLTRAYYLAGEGCPGAEGCTPIESLTIDPQDPTQPITVAITMIVSHDMYHFILEDFIPSGTEILNPNLLTSQTVVVDRTPDGDLNPTFNRWWEWWFLNDPQIYDDHILWVADFLPAGTYTLTYHLLPTQRGAFQVLPAHAWQYFYPEVQGTSAGDLFTIE